MYDPAFRVGGKSRIEASDKCRKSAIRCSEEVGFDTCIRSGGHKNIKNAGTSFYGI